MEESIRKFLTHMEIERGSTQNTLLAYRTDLGQFQFVIRSRTGQSDPRLSLTRDSVSEYVLWLDQQSYKPSTISRKMAAVRSYLTFLEAHVGLDAASIAPELKPPASPRQDPRILSYQEVHTLLEAPARSNNPRGLRDTAILALLYTTGFRVAEVVSLRTHDVDLRRNLVLRPPERVQEIPLGLASDKLQRYLVDGRPHLKREMSQMALFLNQRGQGLSRQGLWLVVKRWSAEAGLEGDISPYTLRHTLARNMLDLGKTRKEVQKFLGLSSPNAIRIHRISPPRHFEE